MSCHPSAIVGKWKLKPKIAEPTFEMWHACSFSSTLFPSEPHNSPLTASLSNCSLTTHTVYTHMFRGTDHMLTGDLAALKQVSLSQYMPYVQLVSTALRIMFEIIDTQITFHALSNSTNIIFLWREEQETSTSHLRSLSTATHLSPCLFWFRQNPSWRTSWPRRIETRCPSSWTVMALACKIRPFKYLLSPTLASFGVQASLTVRSGVITKHNY